MSDGLCCDLDDLRNDMTVSSRARQKRARVRGEYDEEWPGQERSIAEQGQTMMKMVKLKEKRWVKNNELIVLFQDRCAVKRRPYGYPVWKRSRKIEVKSSLRRRMKAGKKVLCKHKTIGKLNKPGNTMPGCDYMFLSYQSSTTATSADLYESLESKKKNGGLGWVLKNLQSWIFSILNRSWTGSNKCQRKD